MFMTLSSQWGKGVQSITQIFDHFSTLSGPAEVWMMHTDGLAADNR
jgi:hypothetical protein